MPLNERLKKIKEKQAIRRKLLAQQLGVKNSNSLVEALGKSIGDTATKNTTFKDKSKRLEKQKVKTLNKYPSQIKKESPGKVYKDSSTFLKGTQSLNPHNDYCQNYVDTGERPQNFIRDVGLEERFGEYPKLKNVVSMKDEVIRATNTPPTYLHANLRKFDLSELGMRFDVILIEPPLEEYKKTQGLPITEQEYSWDELEKLNIDAVAGQRSFVFLWCGSSDGVDRGRRCLKRWNYRRCEDICWIKTNKIKSKITEKLFEDSLLSRTKEHCLMGIRGTVRRSTDGDFIHANIDIDLIIEEEKPNDEKPEEIFHIIEHFCLGRRRLHLFGKDVSIRPGWLTVGPQVTCSNLNKETYAGYFQPTVVLPGNIEGKPPGIVDNTTTGSSEEIERLRPKTPPPRGEKKQVVSNQPMRFHHGNRNAQAFTGNNDINKTASPNYDLAKIFTHKRHNNQPNSKEAPPNGVCYHRSMGKRGASLDSRSSSESRCSRGREGKHAKVEIARKNKLK